MTISSGKIVPCIIEEAIDLLMRVDGMNGLDLKDIRHIAMLMQKQQWPTGVDIFKELDPADAIYFIDEGEVGIWRDNSQVMTLGMHAIFGEMGILDELPRRATVKTNSNCTCYVLPARLFRELVDNNESLAKFFDELINSRLSKSI